jgi:hypothetical protein
MKSGAYILGGLLEGVGQGMVLQGAATREASLRMLEREMINAENARDRDFRAGESQKERDARVAEANSQREFTSGENELNRGHQTALQDDQQTFTGAENKANRDATAANSAADRAARAESDRLSDARADKDRVARLDEAQKDRAWKAAEARIEREFRGNENAANRQARFDEILIEEEGRERARQHDRDMQDDQQTFTGDQNDKNRGQTAEENQKNRDATKATADADRQERADARNDAAADDLTEVYDENSPTGSTLTPKGRAAGKPGVPTGPQLEAQTAAKDSAERAIQDRAAAIVDDIPGSWFSSDTSDFGQGGRAAAQEQVADAIRANKDSVVIGGQTIKLKGTADDGGEASPAGESPAKPDAQSPSNPRGTGQALPSDPKLLKKGVIYQTKRGQAEYLGDGKFKLVK